jgi:hypothetical protein
VRLYSVVVILGGSVRVGCARLLCGHCGSLPLAWRSRFALVGSGAFPLPYVSNNNTLACYCI